MHKFELFLLKYPKKYGIKLKKYFNYYYKSTMEMYIVIPLNKDIYNSFDIYKNN